MKVYTLFLLLLIQISVAVAGVPCKRKHLLCPCFGVDLTQGCSFWQSKKNYCDGFTNEFIRDYEKNVRDHFDAGAETTPDPLKYKGDLRAVAHLQVREGKFFRSQEEIKALEALFEAVHQWTPDQEIPWSALIHNEVVMMVVDYHRLTDLAAQEKDKGNRKPFLIGLEEASKICAQTAEQKEKQFHKAYKELKEAPENCQIADKKRELEDLDTTDYKLKSVDESEVSNPKWEAKKEALSTHTVDTAVKLKGLQKTVKIAYQDRIEEQSAAIAGKILSEILAQRKAFLEKDKAL